MTVYNVQSVQTSWKSLFVAHSPVEVTEAEQKCCVQFWNALLLLRGTQTERTKSNESDFFWVKKNHLPWFLFAKGFLLLIACEKSTKQKNYIERCLFNKIKFYVQWNPINTDTKRTCHGVRIVRVKWAFRKKKRHGHMFIKIARSNNWTKKDNCARFKHRKKDGLIIIKHVMQLCYCCF